MPSLARTLLSNLGLGGGGNEPPSTDLQLGNQNGEGFFYNAGQLGSLATGLAGAYNAYRQNKLQKDAFDFSKASTNRNIANQAVTINNQLANQAKMQAQMFGNKVGTQDYQNYLAENQRSVDGSAL